MSKKFPQSPLAVLAIVCHTAGLTVLAHSALADNKDRRPDEQRIDDRMIKDADDRLHANLADDDKRQALKKELVRAEALRQMAETLSQDPKFQQSFTTLLKNSDKRHKDVMPDDDDVLKEKSSIINDPDATRMVMARALLMLDGRDHGHH